MKHKPRFSKQTVEFIKKASKQKKDNWLDKNKADYDQYVRHPLQAMAEHLEKTLRPHALSYHFPQKGIGRLRRSKTSASQYGGGLYKSYISYTASRPATSRFEHNPSIFFMINSEDTEGDEVLLAGGLYMPSSQQMKKIRENIIHDGSAFEKLFNTTEFKKRFPGGFSLERKMKRNPRGVDPTHPRVEWLMLQGFYVWRSYRVKEYSSKDFFTTLEKDAKQILRLNSIFEQIINSKINTHQTVAQTKKAKKESVQKDELNSRINDLKHRQYDYDF